MAILFILGANDHGFARVEPDANGQINIRLDGNCHLLGRVDLGGVKSMPLILYGPNTKQPTIEIPEKPSLIVNQVADPDNHRRALQRCADLCRRMINIPVINPPDVILQSMPDQVAERLQGIPGVRAPRTIASTTGSPEQLLDEIEARGLGYPVVTRAATNADRFSTVRIRGRQDLDRLHALPFDGSRLYSAEYIDCSDSGGIHFRHRIVVIDGAPVVREVLFDQQWRVTRDSREFMNAHPELGHSANLAEALERERLPGVEAALREVRERLNLDVFGIDGCLGEDGILRILKVGAHVDLLISSGDAFDAQVAAIQEKLRKLLQARSGEEFGPLLTWH